MERRISSLTQTLATGTVDDYIIALMRLVLAAAGMLIIYIVPTEPSRFVIVTYTVLSLYIAYSAVLYILAVQYSQPLESFYKWVHWIDVGWYALLIALTRGTSSIFFFGFFFAILVASFQWGFAAGLRVTIISVILFTTVGFATTPPEQEFELDRFLIRPVFLLVLGYMTAYWGGFEIRLKRRLALLKEVTTLSNPRFGIDRTLGLLIERLRTFYNADGCLLVSIEPATGEHCLRYADGRDPEAAVRAEPIPMELAQQLLSLPAEHAVVYSRPHHWWRLGSNYYALDTMTGERTAAGQEASAILAARFDAESFVAVPMRDHNEAIGRLYLISRQRRAFDESDVDFLLQLIEQVMPIIDNIRLVDRLASNAAEEERQRIARDLHDSVIQPYIGIHMGLTGIDQKLAAGADVSHDVKRLITRMEDEIAELRDHMHSLKGSDRGGGGLVPAVQRFAAKFAETTHLNVHVETMVDMRYNDRLAAEVFQMVSEGLSNVRRHTQATQARITLLNSTDHLILRIENDVAEGVPPAQFTPRSITERAVALGGRVYVEQHGGTTAVVVEIPL